MATQVVETSIGSPSSRLPTKNQSATKKTSEIDTQDNDDITPVEPVKNDDLPAIAKKTRCGRAINRPKRYED